MKHPLILALLGLSLVFSACDKVDDGKMPKISADEMKSEVEDKVTSIKEKAAQEREEFFGSIQKEMDKVDKQMEGFTQHLEETSGEVKLELNQQLEKLKQERYEVEQKILEMRSETSENWHEMKAGVTEAINHLRKSINDARGANA